MLLYICAILWRFVAWQEILQKDNGFDRCISGSTAAGDDLSDLEPLEDLHDFEAATWEWEIVFKSESA